MEIITSEQLISTGYRFLFETIKKKGIGPVLDFVQDMEKLPKKTTLLRQTILGEENDLIKLKRKHNDMFEYLREHKGELYFNLPIEKVSEMLVNVANNDNLLELYLENARKLEELKVSLIEFCTFFDYWYQCDIYRNDNGQIIVIDKRYNDGEITKVEDEVFQKAYCNYSCISYMVNTTNMSFSFQAQNNEHGYQYRYITIKDFGFDASKLPTEEEIQSYEIPKQLVKK